MKVENERRWATTRDELNASEEGREFLAFFERWFTEAECLLDDITPPAEAMRRALTAIEAELGFLSVSWIGQQLCVAAMHWEHGKTMVEELTYLEMRVLEESLSRKIEELQSSAEEATAQA